MTLAALYLLAGLGLLYAGAELLVRGSASLAGRLGLTPLVIGLTVVAFGTSAPELAVSVAAALQGNGALAVGNVIGSNIANIAFILGVAALIAPLAVHAKIIRVDIPLLIGVSGVTVLLSLDGDFSRREGLALTAGLVVYVGISVGMARREHSRRLAAEYGAVVPAPADGLATDLVRVLAGLALLVWGANWLVDGAVSIARALGVSQAVIGLTVVALGTSLPELATSVVAALRRHTDLALGNVIGSNLFNLLGILGISSALAPYQVTGIRMTDWLAMLGVTLVLLPLAATHATIKRWEGGLLCLLYAGYIAYLALRSVGGATS